MGPASKGCVVASRGAGAIARRIARAASAWSADQKLQTSMMGGAVPVRFAEILQTRARFTSSSIVSQTIFVEAFSEPGFVFTAPWSMSPR